MGPIRVKTTHKKFQVAMLSATPRARIWLFQYKVLIITVKGVFSMRKQMVGGGGSHFYL